MAGYPRPGVQTLRYASTRMVSLGDATGEICAEMPCPYPPGIPIIVRGERYIEALGEVAAQLVAAGLHARLRERDENDGRVQIEPQTRQVRERWTLALGRDGDRIVTSIVDASQRTTASSSATSQESRHPS